MHERVSSVEDTANIMFDRLVHAGISPVDEEFVNLALQGARDVFDCTAQALADGTLTLADLYDDNYVEIEGSNPPRYRNRAVTWTDANWRPIFDRVKASHPAVMGSVCMDWNGYLPAHLSERSRKPTGNREHDGEFCRNGLLFADLKNRYRNPGSEYTMGAYRYSIDDKTYSVVRVVYVPLIFDGRRWGEFNVNYAR